MKIYTPSNQHKSRNSSRLSRRRENKYEMDKVSLSFYRRNIDAIFWKTTRNGTNRISISVVIVSGVLVVEAWLRLNFREASKRVCFRSTPDFLPARNANWIIKCPCPHSCRFQRKLPSFFIFFFLTINQNATTSFTPLTPSFPSVHRSRFIVIVFSRSLISLGIPRRIAISRRSLPSPMGIPTAPFVIHFALNTGHQIKLSSPSHLVFLRLLIPAPPSNSVSEVSSLLFLSRLRAEGRRFVDLSRWNEICADVCGRVREIRNNKEKNNNGTNGVKQSEKPMKSRQNGTVISRGWWILKLSEGSEKEKRNCPGIRGM